MNERKQELLKALEEELKNNDMIGEMSLFTSEELNSPSDMLRAEIANFGTTGQSVLGEFLFLPIEDEELYYFTSVINLTFTLERSAAEEIARAASRLNYYLPVGGFALGGEDDSNLVFKYMVPVLADADIGIQKKTVFAAADRALLYGERFEAYLS
ncbi:MAG: hypothetical protein IJU50_02070, partial [Lachnospiraceae bacterium]|nr:hypothetical protein [Lachnospiraceae bacterium]